MQKLRFDLRVVLRQLAKSPGFAITAVLMLALGIGATTAIFSIVEAVLLRPLPFPDSERLMILSDKIEGVKFDEIGVTVPDIKAYPRDTHGFDALGGYQFSGYELSGNGDPAQVNGARLTAGVFAALGVQPLMGRVFTAEEEEHSQQVAVLSYGTWVRRFHGDPQILGQKIQLDRKPYIIIGVMPREFRISAGAGATEPRGVVGAAEFHSRRADARRGFKLELPHGGAAEARLVRRSRRRAMRNRVAQQIMRNFPPIIANLHISAMVKPLQAERDRPERGRCCACCFWRWRWFC